MNDGTQPAKARAGIPAIYHVMQENGKGLLISTPGLSGWVANDEVVPLEEAAAFFGSQIQGQSK